jgi:hypothetical protein
MTENKAFALAFMLAFVSILAITAPCHAQTSITIDSIVENDSITGRVSGLPSAPLNFKVVVYVHTDVWYIHPYASGGPGKSFALIAADGTWTIDTVKRQFAANSVAALVVSINLPVPNKIASLGGIRAVAKVVLDRNQMRQRGFLGKL